MSKMITKEGATISKHNIKIECVNNKKTQNTGPIDPIPPLPPHIPKNSHNFTFTAKCRITSFGSGPNRIRITVSNIIIIIIVIIIDKKSWKISHTWLLMGFKVALLGINQSVVSHYFLSVYDNMVHLSNLTREWTLICWSILYNVLHTRHQTKYRKNMMGMTTKLAKLEVAALD